MSDVRSPAPPAPPAPVFSGTGTLLFAHYNRWMNEKLYAAAARLSDEERKRDLKAFFKSLHGTLDHILFADIAWLARFRGQPVTLPKMGTILFPDFDELARARIQRDQEILDWAATVTPEWLARPVTWTSVLYGRTFTHPGFALAAQFFNHQTHHRGQATTLLMQLGIDPGETDIPLLPELNP